MLNDECGESPVDLRERTKMFALRVIRLYSAMDRKGASEVIARQLLRSGTSVGAQYREACRARSTAEFVSKMESATQELDETGYWIELLTESNLVPAHKMKLLSQECRELTAIFVASCRTAKNRRKHKEHADGD